MHHAWRRRLARILSLAVAAWLPALPALAAGPYQVVVNGTPVAGAKPFLRDGQLLSSTWPLARALGLTPRWDPGDRRVELSAPGHALALWQDSRTAFHNGTRLEAPGRPALLGGEIYVPTWFVAAQFGYPVTWDGQTMGIRTRPQAGAVQGDPLASPAFVFPFPQGAKYEPLQDNYGDPRSWSPDGQVSRRHEGIDILSPKGTPVVAAGSGKVVRIGWNEYGGWRLTVALDAAPGISLYYAHLNGYGPGLYEGARVKAGQLVGYVGNTGYGPEGTEGKFVPHLHVGLYRPDGTTLNPFPYLQRWESRKVVVSSEQ